MRLGSALRAQNQSTQGFCHPSLQHKPVCDLRQRSDSMQIAAIMLVKRSQVVKDDRLLTAPPPPPPHTEPPPYDVAPP